MRTNVTLVLADQKPAPAAAHDELYPERVDEHIPLWVSAESVTQAHAETLRATCPFGGP
jgi:hypothetical protein